MSDAPEETEDGELSEGKSGIPDKLFFRIGEAASLVGVEPHVLRYWESEFKIRTQRSSTGQRTYRRKDIMDFMAIRKLLHEDGFTIAGARKALEDGLPPDSPAVVDRVAGSANDDRVREAIDRLKATRARLGTLSERYRALGVAAFTEGD